jgi:hypothetical protein
VELVDIQQLAGSAERVSASVSTWEFVLVLGDVFEEDVFFDK